MICSGGGRGNTGAFVHPYYSIKRLKVIIAPTEHPVTLEEVKAWLGGSIPASDDAMLSGLIAAATNAVEEYCRRKLMSTGLRATLDAWPANASPAFDGVRQGPVNDGVARALSLHKPPLISVEEVRYFGDDNASTIYDASNYFVDNSDPDQYGRLVLNDGADIPHGMRNAASVEVDYIAGYGGAADIPFAIRQAILMAIAHMYGNRGDCNTGDGINSRGGVLNPLEASGAAGILEPYRILRI